MSGDLEKQVNRMSLAAAVAERLNDNDSASSTCSDNDSSQEEENWCDEPVRGLFSRDRVFDSVKELFKHEYEVNKFNIVRVCNDYQMSMFDYIKLINFIRREKPELSLFDKKCDNVPWSSESYLKVEIENDPLLQFDVEEDLDLLELPLDINNNSQQSEQCKELAYLKKRLEQAESKIEELVEINDKLKTISKNLLTNGTSSSTNKPSNDNDDDDDDDSTYIDSYSNYSIHLEMLQDKVRTEGYMNAILQNKDVFRDKVVLDVGCGTGILSMFAAKAGAKLVIAVDMSDIIGKAIEIAKENELSQRIVYLKGKVEEVKMPVDKVDIIISEWMGYFLLFESMLDSVLFARDKYLKPDGLVLPNFFEMHVFGVSDATYHERKLGFWSNVYGFKMNCMRGTVATDGQVLTIPSESVITDMVKFKEIDCLKCRVEDLKEFETEFCLNVTRGDKLTGLGVSFDTFFNHSSLQNKSSFSTSPFHTPTHWEQTLFQFQEPVEVKQNSKINGRMKCYKNPSYLRSYVVELFIFDKSYLFKVE